MIRWAMPWPARPLAFIRRAPAVRSGAVASGTTAADGSFSVSVSPGTYDVSVDYNGDSTDPCFGICTENVDLTTSVDDTLTVPVTQLTVTAENSDGDLLQGATIPANTAEAGFLAAFDFFPGQPIDNNSYLFPDHGLYDRRRGHRHHPAHAHDLAADPGRRSASRGQASRRPRSAPG